MRKRILYAASMAVVSMAAFFIGKNTIPVQDLKNKTHLDLNDREDFNLACDFMGQIVDWSICNDEIAVMTSNGYELYATKSQDYYKPSYLPVADIEDMFISDNGIQFFFKNGTGYYWERKFPYGYKQQ